MRRFALTLLVLACAGPSGVSRVVGPSVALSSNPCGAPGVDQDRDGVEDACELALAQAFAPELLVDKRDCLWLEDELGGRLAGGYFFAAGRTASGIRVAYLPAYYRDCGWSGPVCVLRGRDCGAHAGDSEMIVVDVAPDTAGRWRVTGIFLSAHCFGRSDGRCRWYRDQDLASFAMVGDGPAARVWVARGKHANYPSQHACDTGHWFYDSCDGSTTPVRFPIISARQNMGSSAHHLHPGGCVAASALPLGSDGANASARECFWDATRPFVGWQGADARGSASPYERYLRAIANF